MRAWLVVCAALALAPPCRATAAHPQPHPHQHQHPHPHQQPHQDLHPATDPARLDRIKSQILAKLGLSSRPTPLGAPPRDVVRQILARAAAADPQPHAHAHAHEHAHGDALATGAEQAMREVIAIAHRGPKRNIGDCLPKVDASCVTSIYVLTTKGDEDIKNFVIMAKDLQHSISL